MIIREFTGGIWRRRELTAAEEREMEQTRQAAMMDARELTDRERLDELEACVLELAAIIGGEEA